MEDHPPKAAMGWGTTLTDRIAVSIGTLLGVGMVFPAPGTFGTLATVPLWLILAPLGLPLYGAAVSLITLAGIWAAGHVGTLWGNKDPGAVVIDETAGFLIAVAFVPVTLVHGVAGFALFRLLDITKPWPVGWLDKKLTGGIGVMMDDLAAGAMTAVLLLVADHFFL